MAKLEGQTIAASFDQLLHVDTEGGGNGTTLVPIKDGNNDTTFALQMSTTKVMIEGNDNKLYFSNEGNEWISSNGTNLTINATDGNVFMLPHADEAVCVNTTTSFDNFGPLQVKCTDDHVGLSIVQYGGDGSYDRWGLGVHTGSGHRNDSLLFFDLTKDNPRVMFDTSSSRGITVGEEAIENDSNIWYARMFLGKEDSNTTSAIACHSDTSANVPRMSFIRSRGSTSSPTIVQDGNYLGHIRWHGYIGSEGDTYDLYDVCAGIDVNVLGTPANTEHVLPTQMLFRVQGVTGSGIFTPMNISPFGNVAVGHSTSVTDDYRFYVKSNITDKAGINILHTQSGARGLRIQYSVSNDVEANNFIYCTDAATVRFRVKGDGDMVADGVDINSDSRLKRNITDATPKLDDLNKLKVRNFYWRETDEESGYPIHSAEKAAKKQLGLIAQEAETVFPSLVTETIIQEKQEAKAAVEAKDAVYAEPQKDSDGNVIGPKELITEAVLAEPAIEARDEIKRKSIKWSVMVPILIKAVQELSAKVTALENA